MKQVLDALGTKHVNPDLQQRRPDYLYADFEVATSSKEIVSASVLDETLAPRPSLRAYTCIPCIKKYRNANQTTQLVVGKQLSPNDTCDCASPNQGSRCNVCKADPTKPACISVRTRICFGASS